jgi:hypothetical protein
VKHTHLEGLVTDKDVSIKSETKFAPLKVRAVRMRVLAVVTIRQPLCNLLHGEEAGYKGNRGASSH